jgi:hypothetical protein
MHYVWWRKGGFCEEKMVEIGSEPGNRRWMSRDACRLGFMCHLPILSLAFQHPFISHYVNILAVIPAKEFSSLLLIKKQIPKNFQHPHRIFQLYIEYIY